jgi:hypothetical protein
MLKTHPHAEAIYRVIPESDGSFAIEVKIPDSHPTKVTPFATQGDAERWIADHRRRVEAQSSSGRSWHRSEARSARA